MPLPYVRALHIGKLAMIDAQTVAEDSLQTVGELGCEHYLRQQVKHLLSLCYSLSDKVYVHLGLA